MSLKVYLNHLLRIDLIMKNIKDQGSEVFHKLETEGFNLFKMNLTIKNLSFQISQ